MLKYYVAFAVTRALSIAVHPAGPKQARHAVRVETWLFKSNQIK